MFTLTFYLAAFHPQLETKFVLYALIGVESVEADAALWYYGLGSDTSTDHWAW